MILLNNLYKKIYFWYFSSILILIPGFLLQKQALMFFIHSVFTLFFTGLVLYKLVALFKKVPGSISVPYLGLAFVVVAGGSILDMFVTVICSPDLSEEGNIAVRLLLSHHAPLWFVYLIGLFYQILHVSIDVLLFSCFLKTYPSVLKTIPYLNFFTTVKWLMGCGKVKFVDLLLGRNLQYQYLMPSLIFMVGMNNLTHFYAVMEWLNIIPTGDSFLVVSCCGIFISLLTLALMTHFKLRNNLQYAIK